MMVSGAKGGQKLSDIVQKFTFSFMRRINSKDLMDSRVTIVTDMIFYTWKLLKGDRKHSHNTDTQTVLTM